MSRFFLTIGSFAVIVGMYALYDRFAVPILLPEQKSSGILDGGDSNRRRDELSPYFSLFPEDSWERDPEGNIQKLEIDQTIILWRTDETDGNTIKLMPCTILFLDKNPDLSEEERIRQAFVMRTLEHAEIEFDGPVDFSHFPLPKIKEGRLLGKVSIHSDMKNSGPQDDFHLDTENVVFTETPAQTRISTLKDVAFRWGVNSGEGSVLHIALTRPDSKNEKSSKELTEFKFDSLRCLNMILSDSENTVAVTPAPPKIAVGAAKTESQVPPLPNQPSLPPINVVGKTATLPLGTATTLDVNCQREFVFVPGEKRGDWIAKFTGNVLAVRTNLDGSTDQITGDELQVLFSPRVRDAKTGTAPKSVNLGGLGSMEPVQFMVCGKMGRGDQPPEPARLNSKQNGGFTMIGDQIRYDLRKNELFLETEKIAGASKNVSLLLQNNRYVLQSTKGFFYKMNPNGGIGRLVSSSPGNLQGTMGEGDQLKKVAATWNALQAEPYQFDPKQVLIKMEGGILFEMQGFGKMTADTLHLLCFASEGASSPTPNKTPDSALLGGVGALTPDRATILGKVHFENENGTCDVQQMDIVFETVAPDGKVLHSPRTSQLFCETPPRFTLRHNPVVSPERLEPDFRNPLKPIFQQVQYREQRTFGSSPQARPAVAQPVIANQGPSPGITTAAPVTSNPVAVKSEPGGFLGLRSGTSRSAYAITGDRMKMLVLSRGGHSEPRVIQLYGNVRVVENVVGLASGESVEILGEEIGVWNPSTPSTLIQIKGKPPRDAEFRGKGATLRAMEINISRADNLIWSDGAGRLFAVVPDSGNGLPSVAIDQRNTKPGSMPIASKPGGDNRLVVDWSEQMSFDGKTIVFLGKQDQSGIRVRAFYQHTRLFADVMRIYLNRLVSFFDDQSDVPVKAESIECSKNVYVQMEEFENNQPKSVSIGRFEGVRVYVETGDFGADGPGEIQRTFVNDGKGFSVSGSAPPKGLQIPKSGLAHLYVSFHKNVRGNYLTTIAEINGSVRCMYCPVDGWDTKLGIEDQNSVAKRGYLMNCEKLMIVQMPNPGGETQSLELTATGGTTIEGVNNLFAGAETVKYNQAKGFVVFDGDNFRKATVHAGKKQTSAQKLEYNMETGALQVLNAEGFEISR